VICQIDNTIQPGGDCLESKQTNQLFSNTVHFML